MAPIFPVFLVMKETILGEASKKYQVCLKKLTNLQNHVGQYVKTDLGMESHCQLTLTIILVLLAYSETRTIVGFEELFAGTFFYIPIDTALPLSITWSLLSCVGAFLKGISKKRKHSTATSTGIILVYSGISIFLRTFSIVLYWTPCLGLLNCLRHLQGERYPFLNPNYGLVNATTDTFYFGDAEPIPWYKITRWNYTGVGKAEPPSQTLYTLFTIEEYFTGFLIALMANICVQMVANRFTNPRVFTRSSWIDSIVHGISTTFIPNTKEEWDEEKGSVAEHKARKDFVFKETLASILINFGFNLFFLSPTIILGN